MIREIETHKVRGLNDLLSLHVLDKPGSGGACHQYRITFGDDLKDCVMVKFQEGPLREVGLNGLSIEVLLAIVHDRLESFQAGPYACTENRLALAAIESAL